MQPGAAALLAAVVFGHSATAWRCNDDLAVRIKDGVVHGIIDSAAPTVRQFLGIPYAKPPVGNLRFAPPERALPFGGLDAKDLGPSCMQYATTVPSIFTHEVLELNLGGLNGTTGPISEDCLTLSIWTPRGEEKTNLPVLVFFYGGAFAVGGTNVPYQLPAQWILRTQSHIVVSFNHRDNIFGFPNAAGLPPDQQNVGLLDQRLAIEWVRDNIASFGGDPTRIGLWGESSGAVAIAYYSYTYRADPIANSVILGSGNEFIDILTYDPSHANFTFVASHFNCSSSSNNNKDRALPHPTTAAAAAAAEQELACMRRVDAHAIEAFIQAHSDAGRTPPLTFSPVVDERTVFANFSARAAGGAIAPLPALIGSNAQDGVPFVVPYDPAGVDAALAEEITMRWFFCPTYRAARARISAARPGPGPGPGPGRVPVYRYVYAGNFSNVSPKGWMGAYHGAELPMVFGTHGLARGRSTELEERTSRAMQDAWVEFVATGGKGMSVEGWVDNGRGEVDGGRVVEFGNGMPARVMDPRELEGRCREMGIA